LLLSGAVLVPGSVWAQNCIVPSDRLVNGGPGKDGIPALTTPEVVGAKEGDTFLDARDLVLGVVINGEARAYPHAVFWWHEVVNDVLGGKQIVVSYCPLTGSGMVYDPVISGRSLNFGVSGLLFDNNLVMFDRATDSLWSQMSVKSICGVFAGTTPKLLPVVQSTWKGWKDLHPQTTVVSFDTGFARNYNRYPYGNYDQLNDTQLLFPHSFIDKRLRMKELVLGIVNRGVARAYPYASLGKRAVVNDDVNGRPVLVVFDRQSQMALPFDRSVEGKVLSLGLSKGKAFPFQLRDKETGTRWNLSGLAVEGPLAGAQLKPIATFSAMWFAWASFNRDTEIYQK
jgi:hypothetical protein